jgi:rod shape-determining protein MreB
LFDKLFRRFSTDLAMDLGTANTLMYVRGKGIIVNEPSVVVISKGSGKLVAIGAKAKAMYGKTPDDYQAIRPMKDGVIADFDSTKKMIAYFIQQARTGRFRFRPRIVIGVPSGITQVEKRAVIDSALAAGVREVYLIEEPMAAAIGTKMPVGESVGNLIVDIGGGTTEVAIISLYATAYAESIRVAGDEMDEAVVRYAKTKFNMDIGLFEAERVKMAIGSAYPLDNPLQAKVFGRNLVTGLPGSIVLTDTHLREAIEEPVKAICIAVRTAMEKTTPEFAQDISNRGIVLAGGGALIKGLGARLSKELGIPVFRSKDPLTAVCRGAGTVLEEWETLKRVTIN